MQAIDVSGVGEKLISGDISRGLDWDLKLFQGEARLPDWTLWLMTHESKKTLTQGTKGEFYKNTTS